MQGEDAKHPSHYRKRCLLFTLSHEGSQRKTLRDEEGLFRQDKGADQVLDSLVYDWHGGRGEPPERFPSSTSLWPSRRVAGRRESLCRGNRLTTRYRKSKYRSGREKFPVWTALFQQSVSSYCVHVQFIQALTNQAPKYPLDEPESPADRCSSSKQELGGQGWVNSA